MFERVFISCKKGDGRIDRIPFLNVSSDPALNAWITKYNSLVEQTNRVFVALNEEHEQAQPQEEIWHVGAGRYNQVTKAWEDEGITPQANTEAESHGADERDVILKKWV